jgi:predicted amidophosphoribosyltransferase
VPVPSKPRSVRRRGVALSDVLARAVARSLALPTVTALRAHGGHSRGQSSVGRWDAAGVRVARPIAPRAALLIDDVVTTGATLARAADALEGAGSAVLGALVLAATPRRDVGR